MAYVFGLPQDVTELIYSMRVWMPRRPRHGHVNNSFMLDFENDLRIEWGHPIPRGPRRFENAAWAQLVQRHVYRTRPTPTSTGMSMSSGYSREACVQRATDIVA